VSYALRLAADANRALLSLPVDLQEEVFDILDRIALEAPAAVATMGEERLVYRSDAVACDVFLFYTIDHDRRTVHFDRLAAVIYEDR
jgi:hypothetical protein